MDKLKIYSLYLSLIYEMVISRLFWKYWWKSGWWGVCEKNQHSWGCSTCNNFAWESSYTCVLLYSCAYVLVQEVFHANSSRGWPSLSSICFAIFNNIIPDEILIFFFRFSLLIVFELQFFKKIKKRPVKKSEKIHKTTKLDNNIFELLVKVEKKCLLYFLNIFSNDYL